MSVASEIERLEAGKAGIVASIRAKGVEVSETDKLEDLASKIDGIEGVSPTVTSVLYDVTGVSDGTWTKTGKVQTATIQPKAGASVGKTVIYGATGKGSSRLPSGYTEVEYVQSDGSSRIDTGLFPTNNMSYELVLEPTAQVSTANFHMLSSNSSRYFVLRLSDAKDGFQVRWGSSTLTTVPHDGQAMAKHVFKLTKNVMQIDEASPVTFTNVSFKHTYTLPLFCANSSSGYNNYSCAKCYALKIWEGDEMTRDFVPCVRDSDGEAGLYDLVGGKFYQGEGSGNITAGPELAENLKDVSISIGSDVWEIDLGGKEIPEGRYAVINADGTAYLGREALPNQTMPQFSGQSVTVSTSSNVSHYFDMQYQS